jgi:hypothetical protein
VNFDPSQVDESEEFALLPDGRYHFTVSWTDFKPTKSGTGHVAAVTLDVIDGPFKGRKLFCNFNVQNTSAQAEQIGKAQFKRFLAATGVDMGPKPVNEFLRLVKHKTLWGDVGRKVGGDGNARNEVKKYLPEESEDVRKHEPEQAPAANDLDSIPF